MPVLSQHLWKPRIFMNTCQCPLLRRMDTKWMKPCCGNWTYTPLRREDSEGWEGRAGAGEDVTASLFYPKSTEITGKGRERGSKSHTQWDSRNTACRPQTVKEILKEDRWHQRDQVRPTPRSVGRAAATQAGRVRAVGRGIPQMGRGKTAFWPVLCSNSWGMDCCHVTQPPPRIFPEIRRPPAPNKVKLTGQVTAPSTSIGKEGRVRITDHSPDL